jgi:hypothetical protein
MEQKGRSLAEKLQRALYRSQFPIEWGFQAGRRKARLVAVR